MLISNLSLARKKQWATLSPDERKNRLKIVSDARWKGTTKQVRSEHARKMAIDRWNKIKA